MDIHAYSGFVANDNLVKSRTAGILAALLETYPSMTWDDVLQWSNENGLPDWVPNIDTDDSQKDRLIGGEYSVMFDSRFPWTSAAQSNFKDWAAGYEIGKLPPIQTASPAIQQVFAQPAPVSDPDLTGWDSPAPAQQSFPEDPALAAWDSSDPEFSQPAPAPTPTPIYTQSPAPTAPTTPAPTPVPYPKPTNQPAKKDGSNNMLLIVGGLIVAYMVMKKRKK